MRLNQVLDHIVVQRMCLILGKVHCKALLRFLLALLSARSFEAKLDIGPNFQGLCFGEFAEQWVEIQLERVASHLDYNFPHKLKL